MVPAMGDVYLSIATRSRHLIVLAGKTKLYVVVITRGPIVFQVESTLPPAPAITVMIATAMNWLYGCLIIKKLPPLCVVVRSSEIEPDI